MIAVLCSEVSTTTTIIFVDHENGVALSLLYIHLFQTRMRSIVSNAFYVRFFFQSFILGTICVDKHSTLFTGFENESAVLFERTDCVGLMDFRDFFLIVFAVIIDLATKFFQNLKLETLFFSFECSGGQANDENRFL